VVFKAGYRQRRPKMTPPQIVVLVVMGILVLVLLGVLGKVVMDMLATLNAKSAQPTPQPSAVGTPTPRPTETPTPTSTVEPGFKRYEFPDEGFLINVPEEWAVAEDLEAELEGEFHGWMAPENIYSEAGFLAVIAGRGYEGKTLTIEDLTDWFEGDDEVISYKRVILPIGESQKVQLRMDDTHGLAYLCSQGEYVYVVMFVYTDPEIGDRNEALFEKVAQSFHVMGATVATLTPTPKPLSPDCMPGASFVEDVTVPQDTEFASGETFTKTWTIASDGCADLPEGTLLVFDSGEIMGGPEEGVEVPETPVDETLDVSVVLTAPEEPGTYEAWWQMEAYDGTRFGERLYLKIVVK
jgi:hypothetical protein